MRYILAGIITFVLGVLLGAVLEPFSLREHPCQEALIEGRISLDDSSTALRVCFPKEWAQASAVRVGNRSDLTAPGLYSTRLADLSTAEGGVSRIDHLIIHASLGFLDAASASEIGVPRCTFDSPLTQVDGLQRCLVSSATAWAVIGRPTTHRVFYLTKDGYVLEGQVSLMLQPEDQPTHMQIDAFDKIATELLASMDQIAINFGEQSR